MSGMGRLEIGRGDTTHRVAVSADGSVRIDGRADPLVVTRIDASTLQVTLAGRQLLAYVATEGQRCWVFVDGYVFDLDLTPDAPRPGQSDDVDGSLTAPMPASVLAVLAEPGQLVRKRQPLLLLEAMKMELPVRAPRDGIVESVACQVGDRVEPGQPLVTMRPDGA